MEKVILLSGNVKYSITLDPGVWIFDDRKVDLTTYFTIQNEKQNELEEYTKTISKHWDREIMEGAIFPPTIKTEVKFEKEKIVNGTFGISFKPFLLNSEPNSNAEVLLIQSSDGEIEIPLSIAYDLILKFSNKGKPLHTDGPVHVLFGDGSNINDPIKNIISFAVR